MHNAMVIGGGPAGLSAALILGRCRRRVLLFDAGQPRNARSQALHCYLTREGMPPSEFARAARGEIQRYGVKTVDGEVIAARCVKVDAGDNGRHAGVSFGQHQRSDLAV